MTQFDSQIANALGTDLPSHDPRIEGDGSLPSYFDVNGLALASISAASGELAALTGADTVTINRRHALQWFDMTIRPQGWDLPGIWDPIAGDYPTADGWIRLHTNAPHHRDAALRALGCAGDRETVTSEVARWTGTDLENAIVAEGGCAAEMRGLADWQAHPQGVAVAAEPLIAWRDHGRVAPAPKDLQGLRILDLTRVLAGPVSTRFLAGFGARVLRIDPPHWNEPPVEAEVTLGKRCAGLDLTNAADRSRFEELLSEADVLVHGYRPGALEGLGFDPAQRRALNPGLIDVSLNAYGWSGPWAVRRGFDSLMQMSTGIAAEGMARAGADRPRPLPVQALDHATGYLMAAAILRALRHRTDSGRVLQAQLSLARTAHLLIRGGAQPLSDGMKSEGAEDLSPDVEHTGWGPARRIAFPVTLDGKPPQWPEPAGPVRRHDAVWRRA
ncbi:CoA transferase [Aestuariivita boseongensis]|uniref:CoA transferase n=1 Tax=Aestuariivita boseongensis TaxID=1470562 RepID=UPI00068010E4|nr:CoA transferase [Aestuariivita boseongensis]